MCVAYTGYTFHRSERRPTRGGRGRTFTERQEAFIIHMVLAHNAMTRREMKDKVIADNVLFPNIDQVSLSTIDVSRKKACNETDISHNTEQ